MQFKDNFVQSYVNMLEQQRIRYQYKVIDTQSGEQVFSASSHSPCYYFCQKYGRDHENVPMNIIQIDPEGKEIVHDTFVVARNRNGNYQMYTQATINRIQANTQKYADINQARLARRQQSSGLKNQINQIKLDAQTKIDQLKEQIKQIRDNAIKQINELKGISSDETSADDVSADDISAEETPAEETPVDENPAPRRRRKK